MKIADPTDLLVGKIVNERWELVEVLSRPDGATGSNFSIAFRALDLDRGKIDVFIKFADVESALRCYRGSLSFAEILEKVGREHSYEATLARLCGDRKMTRIVRPLGSGDYEDDAFKYPLPFIVFEWAQRGDAHLILSSEPKCGSHASWWLRALHHATVGASQLHAASIAHQDIKPSNLVFFALNDAKISDLGRAVKKDAPSHNDSKNGDPTHAPPELFYSVDDPNWSSKYLAQDLYMLGSLLFWYFSGHKSLTYALLYETVDRRFFPTNFRGSYSDVLPILERGLSEILDQAKGWFPIEIADDLVKVIAQMCHPDPRKRGHPKELASRFSSRQYSLERYITIFMRLARQLEIHGK